MQVGTSNDCIIKNLVSKPRLCNQFFDIYMHKVEKKKLSFFELMSNPICPVLSNLNYSFIVINILHLLMAFKSNVGFMLTLCWSPKRHLCHIMWLSLTHSVRFIFHLCRVNVGPMLNISFSSSW